jgi:hypothetical protein
MGGALSEEDERFRESGRGAAVEGQPGNALAGLADNKFNNWHISPRIDMDPQAKPLPPLD